MPNCLIRASAPDTPMNIGCPAASVHAPAGPGDKRRCAIFGSKFPRSPVYRPLEPSIGSDLGRTIMKIASGALAALLLAGIGWSPPAHAQGMPQGSYLQSCTNAAMQGDSLVATCRRADGREERSALAGVRRCAGDVWNNNGIPPCSGQGGGVARGQVMAEPGRGREPGPGYGREPGPGYGREPGPGPAAA